MARTNIAASPIPAATGVNLTDATYSTLGVGTDNGVTFDYDPGEQIVLRAPASSATFTFLVPTPLDFSNKSITIPNVTVVVAANKSVLYRPTAIMRQADGKVYLDCSVAGSVLLIQT